MSSENATTGTPVEPLVMRSCCQNTDREVWRERTDDYYADSVHITESGGLGINVGGCVVVAPPREWHETMKTRSGVMRVERSCVMGWPSFGVGMVRFHVTESSWYTMWMVFLTTKFAFGFHVGGVSRSA